MSRMLWTLNVYKIIMNNLFYGWVGLLTMSSSSPFKPSQLIKRSPPPLPAAPFLTPRRIENSPSAIMEPLQVILTVDMQRWIRAIDIYLSGYLQSLPSQSKPFGIRDGCTLSVIEAKGPTSIKHHSPLKRGATYLQHFGRYKNCGSY